MSQPLVLAIEPDLRQAAIVKRIVREKVLADVAVVDSRDAAIEAMRTGMPDVLLLSALLSPRDEDELIAHLKTLENAGHLQTHTIPQLASALQGGDERGGRGLLSAFRKKKDPAPAAGCDPDLFADEIRVFLKRAEEKKRLLQDSNHAAPDMRPSPAGTTKVAAPDEGAAAAPQASSWSSPFEWKPAASSSRSARAPEPPAAEFEPPIAKPEPPAAEFAPLIAKPEPPAAEFEAPLAKPEPLLPQGPFPVGSTPLIPEPYTPILEAAAPIAAAEPLIPEPPVVAAEVAAPIATAEALIAEPVAAPVVESAPSPEPRKKREPRFKIKDPRSAIRDAGLAALGLAPKGIWLRRDGDAPEEAKDIEDLRALLSTLAVPAAIASVSYPRGCRIRRVRVPAVLDPEAAEAAGAVIASGRAGAEHRDRRPSV